MTDHLPVSKTPWTRTQEPSNPDAQKLATGRYGIHSK